MSYFIFVGDMLVMLFMVVMVVWVFVKSSDATVKSSANIPLSDERLPDEIMPDERLSNQTEEDEHHG